MEIVKITCDTCGKDLTNRGDYILKLTSPYIESNSAASFDVYQSPDISRDMHFCGKSCFSEQVKRQFT